MNAGRTIGHAAALLLAAGALSGCVYSADPETGEGAFRRSQSGRLLGGDQANPSAVIAAELAFARRAQEKGQWAAFREYAAGDAVMFVPEQVLAQDWLRKQAERPQAVTWQPHAIVMSCDGSIAVARGAAQYPGGALGEYLTVWERQRNREYRWIADLGRARTEALPAPEFISSDVADCAAAPAAPRSTSGTLTGGSADGTLRWTIAPTTGGRTVTVALWKDGAFREVVSQVYED